MKNYDFGNVEIEFNTNKIFLLTQILYRLESIENKIKDGNDGESYLLDKIQAFKTTIEKNNQGLGEFNRFKDNAEHENMWAEYGEYIASFAQIDRQELQHENPTMADAVTDLMNTEFFMEVEKRNQQYCHHIQERFISQTEPYQEQARDMVGETNAKKIIYMPFTPELFDMEPCCLSDKNGNKEYAIPFTIPTDRKEFEEMFGMQYTQGIESVILFHEKLHADLPTKSEEHFMNPMQRELDSHLKHAIIELLANGKMGIEIANHSNYFESVFHTGKIPYHKRELTTEDLEDLRITDNELLHTQANEISQGGIEHFSKEELGIIKMRGMIYPYVLMYQNRNQEQQVETVKQEIQRDAQALRNIYGENFVENLQDRVFLEQVQKSVKPYDSVLEFAEGMSKELLGIEQIKKRDKIESENENNVKITFDEQEIGKATIHRQTVDKNKGLLQIQQDQREIQQNQDVESNISI